MYNDHKDVVATVTFGTSNVVEGIQDVYKGLSGNGDINLNPSLNPVRDVLCKGNKSIYALVDTVALVAYSVYALLLKMQLLKDTISFKVNTGVNGVEGGSNLLNSADASKQILNAEQVGSALKNDIYHRAASFVPDSQLASGKTFSIIGGYGVQRTLLQVGGELNGKTGVFEYLLDPNGTITHQLFKRGGVINGKIN